MKSTDDAVDHPPFDKDLLGDALQQVGVAVIVFDRAGRIRFTNPAFHALFGYTAEQLGGESLARFWPPGAEKEASELLETALAEGRWSGEVSRYTEAGELIPVHLTAAPLRDGQGRAVGFVSALVDLRAQKAAEEALQERSHALHERVKELSGLYDLTELAGRYDLDEQTYMARVVERLPEAYQYPEVTGARIRLDDGFTVEHGYAETPWVQSAPIQLGGRNAGRLEVCYREPRPDADDGPFLREEAALLKAVAAKVGRSVHERRLQAGLWASERRLRAIVEAVPEVLYIATVPDLETVFVSPAVEGLLGAPPEDFIGNWDRWSACIHADDRARVRREIGEAVAGAQDFRVEYRMAPAGGGDPRWVVDHATVLRSGDGAYLYGTVTDITERKRAEQVARHRAAIESLIADISADLVRRSSVELDPAIDRGLAMLGEFTEADRAYLFEFHADGRRMENTHEWCAPGIEPQIDRLTGLAAADFPHFLERLGRNEPLVVADTAELSEPERGIMRDLRVGSLLLAPLFVAGELSGFIGFDVVDGPRQWPRNDVRLLAVCAQMVAGALSQRQHEAQLHRVNRALRVLGAVNHSLTMYRQEPELLQAVCEQVVAVGGYAMAWVGYAEDDPERTVTPVQWAGDENGYLGEIRITWADDEWGRGPTGTAIRTGRMASCRFMRTDPRFGPWRQPALARGYASSIALPLSREERTFGALTIYAAEPDAFDADETELLIELASNLSYGIGAMRLRAEREDAVVAMRISEERLRTLVDAQSDAVLVVGSDGRVRFGNPAAEVLLGRESSRLTDSAFGLPISGAGLAEIEIARPGGTAIAEMRTVPFQWGEERALLVTLHDITDRRRSEDALQASEERFELAVRGTSEGIWEWRPRTDTVYCSDRLAELLGFSPEAFEPSRELLWEHLHPDDRAVALAAFRRHIEQHEPLDIEVRLRAASGEYRWYHARGYARWDEEGEPVQLAGALADITERKRYEAQLEYQANYDELTGLANRNLMQDRLEQAVIAAQRYGRTGAVLFLDVDQFKLVNDSLGHDVGDALLQALSRRFEACVYESDTVARYGGDEFMVILSDVDRADHARFVAERILEATLAPLCIAEHELRVTVSIGASIFPQDATDLTALLRNADAAMYRAKELGRNNFQFYSSDLNRVVVERLTLAARLRSAVENADFELHYQPQVDLQTGRIQGVEALLRWPQANGGGVSPAEFIPVAEENGLIGEIGEWVLRTACAQARAWRDAGLPEVPVAVNLSPLQLRNRDLGERIETILTETRLEPEGLELEITETCVMENPEAATATLSALRQRGIRVALDDFGTGHSSLSALSRLPLDRLKIDKAFIDHVTHDPNAATIAQTIIAMAATFRLQVIAEGVETEPQLRYLQRHNCDAVQGYYFSRPVPADEMALLLGGGPLLEPDGDGDTAKRTLLVVDDEVNITRALSRLLRREGFRVLSANDPMEAFDLLALHSVEVIVSDQRMPGMTGTELLSRVKDLYPDVVRIVLSGYTDLATITEAINRGWIYKFLTKPWDDDELRAEIRAAFEHFRRQQQKDTGV